MNIVTVAASPAEKSRSSFLTKQIEKSLLKENADAKISSWSLDDFSPAALVYTRFDDQTIISFQQSIANADIVIFSTPVYKAAYSGGLKLLLDIIPENGLKNKTTLSIATGGTNAHLLVIDYVLKPVIAILGARTQLPGIYVSDPDLKKDSLNNYQITETLSKRLDSSVKELIHHFNENFDSKNNSESKPNAYSEALAIHHQVYY